MPCFLCRDPDANVPTPLTFTYMVNCQTCGNYRLVFGVETVLSEQDRLAFEVACWVYMQNKLGVVPLIDHKFLESMRIERRPSTEKRAELYLGKVIGMLNNQLSGMFRPTVDKLRVASWSFHQDDAVALADYLVALGAIVRTSNPQFYKLIANGHIIYEKMRATNAVSSQVFVAMSFKEAMIPDYDQGFKIAIRDSGYKPLRMDRKEHAEKIDDEIIAEIRRSAFMIADFTEQSAGAYYEAGFMHGLGRQVLFTCKRDHIKDLHFDVRQYNTIVWDDAATLVAPLQNRILALFGAGSDKPDAKPISLPGTQA